MDFWTTFATAGAEYLKRSKKSSSKKKSEDDEPRMEGSQAEISAEEFTTNPGNLLSLQPWVFRKERSRDDREWSSIAVEDQIPWQITPVSGDARRSPSGNKKSGRISAEIPKNIRIPQAYSGNFVYDDFPDSPLPSPTSPSERAFVVTDGKKIISKSSSERVSVCGKTENFLEKEILKAGSSAEKSKEARVSPAYFFCLGVCVGMILNQQSSKKEMGKLKDMIEQRDNLVEGRLDRLDTDGMTATGIICDTLKAKEKDFFEPDVEEKIFSSPKHGSSSLAPKEQQEGLENESLEGIEAELEAELEKLELSVNEMSMDGQDSYISQADTDLAGDIVHGDLGVKIGAVEPFHGRPAPSEPPPSYPVSPRQLSLRLHEVIQFRLKSRIKELEAALRSHQQRQSASSNTPVEDQPPEMSPPLCLNLAGDALEAYHEAYEEFQKTSEAEEGEAGSPDASAGTLNVSAGGLDMSAGGSKTSPAGDLDVSPGGNEVSPGSETPASTDDGSQWSLDISGVEWEDFGDAEDEEGDHDYDDDDGDDDDDDEEERILIQQVLERARKGSPVVENAKKMLSLGVVDYPWDEEL